MTEEETPTYTLYRRDAPDTSIEAAEELDVTKREKMVLGAIKALQAQAGTLRGCISDDVRNYCTQHHNIHSYSSVTARYKSLEDKGLIEYTGEKRKGESGRNQRVMVPAAPQLELPWNL